MRPIYRGRRDALLGALSRHLPDLTPTGISAGLHLPAWLPDLESAEAGIVAAADRARSPWPVSRSGRSRPGQRAALRLRGDRRDRIATGSGAGRVVLDVRSRSHGRAAMASADWRRGTTGDRVYGTLRRGERNHALSGLPTPRHGRDRGRLWALDADERAYGYPALSPAKAGRRGLYRLAAASTSAPRRARGPRPRR
jgi:hypothetical protein